MNDKLTRTRVAAALAALLLSTGAGAQLFKCKGPDGKIVYSDTRCEAAADQGKLAPGVSNRAHENEARAAAQKAEEDKAKAEEQRKADALVEAARKAGLVAPKETAAPAAAPAQPTPPPPYRLTGSDEQRLRNLEVTHASASLTDDQKQAVQWEMDAIRSGRDAKMSASVRARRDSLAQDLGSVDNAKRRQAYSDLNRLYRQDIQ